MNKTITFFAKDLEKKIRLDKFLTNNLKNLSRSQIKKIIVSKNIQVNKKYITASSEKIKENDLVEVNIPEEKTNDINAIKNTNVLPGGYSVNHYLTDPDAFFILTSITAQGEGLKMFQRTAMETSMEPDFATGNIRYKARERYSFGFSDPRCVFGNGNLPT